MAKETIQAWRRKFREYVKAHKGLSLHDDDGNDIAFDHGKPMWNEDRVVDECGDSIHVDVEMDGLVDKVEENRIAVWLRRFAATMGRFGVEVDISKMKDNGADYSVSASMEIQALSKRAKKAKSEVVKDEDDFWIIGDPTISQFMMVEDHGYTGDSCETTSNPLAADRYETYDEAVDALCTQEDVILWAGGTPFPSRVRPLKVDVKVTVRPRAERA